MVIPVEVCRVGQLRVGLWCDACALPSRLEQDWVIIDPRLHETLKRCTTTACTRCGVCSERPRELAR
jgi:hypothetical protein